MILSVKSFGNLYIPCLLLKISLCFTCGERKIWPSIRKSQNIMTMIVGLVEKTTGYKLYEHPIPMVQMKEKGKLTRIYQLNVHFPLFQGQDKNLPDAEITSILGT